MLANHNKGFTLIEILIVLSIFMLLASLSLHLYPKYIQKMETTRFVKQFEEDLYYAQAYAISHEMNVSVYLNASNYTISSNLKGVILQRENPKNTTFKQGTIGLKIFFNNTGAPITSGVVYIETEQDRYKVTIYIGKGRIKIEKI